MTPWNKKGHEIKNSRMSVESESNSNYSRSGDLTRVEQDVGLFAI